MFSASFLVLFIGGVLQETRARSLNLSVNLSLALNDVDPQQQQQQLQQQEQLQRLQQQMSSNLSADMLRTCMKETEMSMAELTRFRVSLLSNDPDIVNGIVDENDQNSNTKVDIDGTIPIVEERNEESLQCFAHCLYEKLGLVKEGIFMEPDFFRKFYTIVEREKQPVRECMNLESSNNCETAYKMHLCYSKLKTIEAERRIREILEYNDNENGQNNGNNEDNNDNNDNNDGAGGYANVSTELPDFDAVDPKDNEIEKN